MQQTIDAVRAERLRLARRIGGLALMGKYGADAIAARARQGLEARFLREAQLQSPGLTGDELAAAVSRIRRAYFVQIRSAPRRGEGSSQQAAAS